MLKSLKLAGLLALVVLLGEGLSRLILMTDIFPDIQSSLSSGEHAYPLARVRFARLYPSVHKRETHGKPKSRSVIIDHPTRGWALGPNLHDPIKAWGNRVLTTNARGLRSYKDYPYEKTGRPRIAVFGDSFVMGYEVGDSMTFCHLLGEMMPGTEILNFGVPNYGHDQMLLYLKEEGLSYRPDVIIVGFIESDAVRNMQTFRWLPKPRFKLKGNRLVLTNVPVPSRDQVVRGEVFKSKLWDISKVVYNYIYWCLNPNLFKKNLHRLTNAIFDEMRRVAATINADIVFVYLPENNEILSKVNSPATLGKGAISLQRQEIGYTGHDLMIYAERAADPNAYFLSLTPNFERHVKSGKRMQPGHWGPEEHRVAAHALREFLEQLPSLHEPPDR